MNSTDTSDDANETTSITTTDTAPEPRPFVPGGDALREAIKARTPPIHPAGYSEPAHSHAVIAGGLVATPLTGLGVPVVHPANPPSAETIAEMQAQHERERAAQAARDAAVVPPTLEQRVSQLEATVARLVAR
jgi:hypothetical protein